MTITCTFFPQLQFFVVLLVVLGLVISAAAVGYQNRDKVSTDFVKKVTWKITLKNTNKSQPQTQQTRWTNHSSKHNHAAGAKCGKTWAPDWMKKSMFLNTHVKQLDQLASASFSKMTKISH